MNFDQRIDGAYTREELLKCQAFIVFSHAEVENYLEKIARRILDEAKKRWDGDFVPDRVIATLLTFRRKELIGPPEDINNPARKSNIREIVSASFAAQEDVIGGNNGIKKSNLSEMFSPLGVLQDDVDEVLLIQLTNIGSLRGELVHKQSNVSLRKIRDPFSDEQKDVDDLIEELGNLDTRLQELSLLSV